MNGRKSMMLALQQVGFAMDDVRLYLDTHPCCAEAMEYFKQLRDKYAELRTEYQSRFGPLTAQTITADKWNWADAPWPWEVDANVDL